MTSGGDALIRDHIGPYYVYLLIDPETKTPFYVGKGTRDRAWSHGLEAAMLGPDEDETAEETGEKLRRIRRIRQGGHEPQIAFARIQIPTQDEAYRVEAALIDTLNRYADRLVNRMRGHDTLTGLQTLEDLEREFSVPAFTTLEPAILIKLFGWHPEIDQEIGRQGYGYRPDMTPEELYGSTRAWWRVSLKRVHRYKYAVAVHEGVTRGVWAIDPRGWHPWNRPDRLLRHAFEGRDAPDEIRDAFYGRIGLRVPNERPDGRRVFGSASPIGFWPD